MCDVTLCPAAIATDDQDRSVSRTDRHPTQQPGQSQVRCLILFKTLTANGKPIGAPGRWRFMVSTTRKTLIILVLAIDWFIAVKCHAAQSCDADTGSLADTLKHPGMKPTPPPRAALGIVNAKALLCERMQGNPHAPRKSEQPGQQRLIGGGFFVIRKLLVC